MRIATKLQGAFVLFVVLLAALLVFHVRTIHGTVESGRRLTAISTRLRVTADVQEARLAQMRDNLAKYVVTHDRRYMDRVLELSDSFGDELRRFQSLPLTGAERTRIRSLADYGIGLAEDARRVAETQADGWPPSETADAVRRLERTLEDIGAETRRLAEASRAAMTRELADAERAAGAAEQVSWLAAGGTLLLSLVFSAFLIRAIVRPLGRLAQGTREISAGNFRHRLDASGGDELAQVGRDFNAMSERLEELDRMKRDFVSNISHDLKSPLSSVQETAGALLDQLAGPLSEKQRQLLLLNSESARRLSSMIAKLLNLSRLESRSGPSLDLVDADRLVRDVIERVVATRPARGPDVILAAPDGTIVARLDADGIGQVLDNLLENALKFSPADGIVCVTLAEHGDCVSLSVADEGPGIPDAEKERVFERFYQTDAGRAVTSRGVGLGLSICRHIVAAHGGTLRATDNFPRGTVFHLLIPGVVHAFDRATSTQSPVLAEAPA